MCFQPEVVIDRVAEFLFAAKVALSRLQRRMPQQKLNLLKLTSCQMAQSRAGPAQGMGRKVRDAGSLCRRLHHMPDRLGCDSIAPDFTHATYSSEDDTVYASRRGPLIHGTFHPRRNRNCTDVLPFANQVGDDPVPLADLEIFCFEPS